MYYKNKKKRIRSKDKIEKKNDKSNKKSVHPGANRDGNLTRYLKNLSRFFGALFWCDSSAKSFLRS